MSLPYGFMLTPDGSVSIDQEKSNTIRTIYQQYLSGISLKGIADFLFAQGIPSPRGKKNRAQNCLTVSTLKLDDVFSDVFGKSSRSIIQHILDHLGEQFDVARLSTALQAPC